MNLNISTSHQNRWNTPNPLTFCRGTRNVFRYWRVTWGYRSRTGWMVETWIYVSEHCEGLYSLKNTVRYLVVLCLSICGFNNENGFRLLGIFSFHSDSHSLKVRDEHIGWNNQQKISEERTHSQYEHLLSYSTIRTQSTWWKISLSHGYKTHSSLGEEIQNQDCWYHHDYLHGSQSQYKGMRWWKHLGTSSGLSWLNHWRMNGHSTDWLRVNYNDIYEHTMSHSSPKQRMLS